MSEPQAIPPNTWTPLLGTDVEILVDGTDTTVTVDVDHYRNEQGDALVEFSWSNEPGARVALRAPQASVTWVDNEAVDNS